MNLLFFDIECANCNDGEGKICSFGYALTNNQLNIIQKNDILINPKAQFFLPKGIKFAYPLKEFRNSPPFYKFYEQIKALLSNSIVFGHAVFNDARYILSECKRYNLAPIDFEFYDTQLMFMAHSKSNAPLGLDKIMAELSVEDMTYHKSDEDAYMSLLTIAHIIKQEKCTLQELLDKYSNCKGFANSGQIKLPPIIDVPLSPSKVINAIYSLGQVSSDFFYNKTSNSQIIGKKFCFEKSYLNDSPNQALFVLHQIKQAGGIYEKRVSKADLIVTHPLFNRQPMPHFKGRYITIDDMLQMLNIKAQDSLEFEPKPYIKKLQKFLNQSRKNSSATENNA